MKRTIFRIFIVCFVFTTSLQAQNYLISFAGSGASTTVNSVQVQNLTQGTSLTLNGTDVLHLTGTTGIKTASTDDKLLKIYPNPVTNHCNIEFEISKVGMVCLDLFDITGRKINSVQKNLQCGVQTFSINGLNSGVYTLTIKTDEGNYSGKIISNGNLIGTATINYINTTETAIDYSNNTVETTEKQQLRSAQTTFDMNYTIGDRILLKGISGNYSTLISFVPTGSSTQTFNFVAATDCDGNNYTTVTIGTQTWMVENLKVTKYNDYTPIPNVTDDYAWMQLSTGAYCNYNNDAYYGAKYGKLYNWYAVNTGKLAPTGWHIPTSTEWQTLNTYVSANYGAAAKALSARTDWVTSTTSGAPGNDLSKNNSTGFSALPGGLRTESAGFPSQEIGYRAYWWSSTQTDVYSAMLRDIFYNYSFLFSDSFDKGNAYSVRCIKD